MPWIIMGIIAVIGLVMFICGIKILKDPYYDTYVDPYTDEELKKGKILAILGMILFIGSPFFTLIISYIGIIA